MTRAENQLDKAPAAKVAKSDAQALAVYPKALGLNVDADRVNKLLVLLAVLVIECGVMTDPLLEARTRIAPSLAKSRSSWPALVALMPRATLAPSQALKAVAKHVCIKTPTDKAIATGRHWPWSTEVGFAWCR